MNNVNEYTRDTSACSREFQCHMSDRIEQKKKRTSYIGSFVAFPGATQTGCSLSINGMQVSGTSTYGTGLKIGNINNAEVTVRSDDSEVARADDVVSVEIILRDKHGNTVTRSLKDVISQLTVVVQGDCERIDAGTGNVYVARNVGNVFASTGTVVVKKNVKGSVKNNTGKIEVNGDVYADAWATTGNVTVNGHVHGNASSTTGNVTHSRVREREHCRD